jgi:hypothetical protein
MKREHNAMPKRILAAMAVTSLAAVGCGGGSERATDTATTPVVTEPAIESTTEPAASPSVDPAALVASADRYGECLADFGVEDEPTTGPGLTGNLVVTVEDGEGRSLTWNVAVGNTGDILTVPADDETIAALESVGC